MAVRAEQEKANADVASNNLNCRRKRESGIAARALRRRIAKSIRAARC